MRVLFLTGSHPRHAAMARSIAASGMLAGLIIERREDFVPEPPTDLGTGLRDLFQLHFSRRKASEEKFFGSAVFPNVPILEIGREELNSRVVIDWISDLQPELLLSYGVHILSEETLNLVRAPKWNIHGGLSPWYRGAITHFWPSYFLQPQFTGMTLHETTSAVDGGRIIHQSVGDLVEGDGLHDLSCRAVLSMANELPEVLRLQAEAGTLTSWVQTTSGRIWTSRDWRPAHLRVIYEFYGDRIVDQFLQGNFGVQAPKLCRQF